MQLHFSKKVNLEPFLTEETFSQAYTFGDPKKDAAVDAIQRENRKYLFGTGFAMGFPIYKGIDTKNKLWFIPALMIFIAGK